MFLWVSCFKNLSENLEDQFPVSYKDKTGWWISLKDFKAAFLVMVLICTTPIYKMKSGIPARKIAFFEMESIRGGTALRN